ncbi:MAG: hypothetical protein CH6_1829 [Candidatus Kapaibacterium sp.]|nr:MAG: hypothetical protein CH6_1829 [Candidatus Kapabacteria bacterium]
MRRTIFLLLFFLTATQFTFATVNLVSPPNNFRCQDVSVEFVWEPYPGGARSYALRVSTYPDLSNPILDTSMLTTTSVTVNLPGANVQYYWRVLVVVNPNPLQLDSSAIWTFTTMPFPPSTIEPSSNSSCNPLNVHFRWSPVNNAQSYRVQISTNEFFLTLVKDTVVSSTQADIKVPNWDTKYFWRVSATTNYGCTTYYSIVDSFKTNRTPPTLLQPADSLTSVWGDIAFAWNVPINANSYNLQITTDPTFNLIVYDEIVSNKNLTKTITDYNTRYYWRVKAVYPDCETEFSPVRTFLTAYSKPENLYPPLDTFCLSNNVTLKWDAVYGATKYRLQVAESDSFDLRKLVIDTLINARQFTYYFEKSLQYYSWRVRAEDNQNTGLWSDVMRFQTTYAPPKHISPANGEETSITVKFVWKRDIDFSTFELQVSDTNNFNLLLHRVYDLKGLTTDTLTLKLPRFRTKYWWRLRASDAYCISDWSQPQYFVTRLQKPNLVFPANNATKMPLKITFEWDKPEGWQKFEIHISKDAQFSSIFKGRVGLNTNGVTIEDFEPNTTYYWRVRAINSEDTSNWSNVFQFTTGPNPLEIPTLIYPENNTDNQPTTLTFVWSAVPRAKFYQLQLASDLQFSQIIYDFVNISDTVYQVQDLKPMSEYFWRVLAYNDSTTSNWSPIWRFRTQPPVPQGPVYLSIPPNESNGVGVPLSLIWNPVQYAEFYHLQVATDENFLQSSLVVDDSTLLLPNKYLTGLEYDTKYFWHVRAYNPAGSTPWSETWWFRTMVSKVEDASSIFFVSYNMQDKLLVISSPNQELTGSLVQMFDLYGRKVFSEFVKSEKNINISCADLSSGIYFLQINVQGKVYVIKVLI